MGHLRVLLPMTTPSSPLNSINNDCSLSVLIFVRLNLYFILNIFKAEICIFNNPSISSFYFGFWNLAYMTKIRTVCYLFSIFYYLNIMHKQIASCPVIAYVSAYIAFILSGFLSSPAPCFCLILFFLPQIIHKV